MRKVFLIVLLFLNVIIFAQEKLYKRDLKWTKNYSVQYGETMTTRLSFFGAGYNDNDALPVFSEIIPLNANNIPVVELVNLNFQDLTQNEIQDIKYLNTLGADINMSTNIVFQRKKPFLKLEFIPIIKNGNSYKKLLSFTIKVKESSTYKNQIIKPLKSYATNSVLSNGVWKKIKVTKDGIYKITYSELKDNGISYPPNVRVYGNGAGMLPHTNSSERYDDLTEIPIYMYKGSDGVFNSGDYILFYVQGPNKWYYDEAQGIFKQSFHLFTDENYYFLTSSIGSAKNISTETPPTAATTNIVSGFNDYQHHEQELINLIKSGRKWFGESFNTQLTNTVNFTFQNLVTSAPVYVFTDVAARNSTTSTFTVSANSTPIGYISVSPVNMSSTTSYYAYESANLNSFNSSKDNFSVSITFNENSPSAEAWLDFITVNCRRSLKFTKSQMIFRDVNSVGSGNVSSFSISDANGTLKVWDVSDIHNVKEMQGSLNGTVYSFKALTDTLREFIAFDNNTTFYKPEFISGYVQNQNLHALSNIDMIILYNEEFLSQAEELQELHQTNDGLTVELVTQQEIFNEFSSGKPDVTAVRDFMKMLYDKANNESEMPKYLLLIGDGSCDNRNYDSDNTNKIITYESANSLNYSKSFVSDDFFGMLDDNEGEFVINDKTYDMLDIGIGRIPVNTVDEAQTVVDKINKYVSSESLGDWRNSACFIGDDEDNKTHMYQADSLAKYLADNFPTFNLDKIYFDAYPQESSSVGERYPDAKNEVNNKINRGSMILNYTGHGGEAGLSHEHVVEISDILSWSNNEKLPLFVTATCEFSRYDDYERTAAGELVLLNPDGGGISMLTTTRLVYSGPNHELNINFYKYVFQSDSNDVPYRLGDIIRYTKNVSSSSINKLNFSLLGDPALTLCYPKYIAATDSINGVHISVFSDTIKALSKVEILGHIEDEYGNKLNSFNGVLNSKVFDKSKQIQTLDNDGFGVFTFSVQNNVLYRGKASVNNGNFKFSFIVPKDISYSIGEGKLSYYADNGQYDAAGYNNSILIGGTSSDFKEDNNGPEIELYLNDENFVFGGMTDENPIIIANVFDSSGINTVGNGIGHDITAIIDNTSKTYILNDYYEAELDDFQKGVVKYQLNDIENGEHSLTLKVWDVYNNSSEETIDFFVEESAEIALKHVLNYPNPFTTHTSFYFEHNRPNQQMEILIQIFTVSGKLVKTISTTVEPQGYRCGPFDWDGLDDYGDKIGKGVYVYRVKVKVDKEIIEKYQKLVILN